MLKKEDGHYLQPVQLSKFRNRSHSFQQAKRFSKETGKKEICLFLPKAEG